MADNEPITEQSERTNAPVPTITKTAMVARMLARSRGATLTELTDATAWQAHTVRAHLTRVRKDKLLERVERKAGPAAYRLARGDRPTEPASNEPEPFAGAINA